MTGAKRLSKQQYEAFDKAGLIDHDKILGTDRGGMVNLGPGAIRGSEKYTGKDHFDPYKWAQEYIVPAMEGMNEAERANFLAKISGGTRNVQRQLEMYTDPGFKEQIEKGHGILAEGAPRRSSLRRSDQAQSQSRTGRHGRARRSNAAIHRRTVGERSDTIHELAARFIHCNWQRSKQKSGLGCRGREMGRGDGACYLLFHLLRSVSALTELLLNLLRGLFPGFYKPEPAAPGR